MIVTVIICTLNRSNYLDKALESLANQIFDPSSFEVIVVDNGSTDNTKNTVISKSDKFFNLRYIFEPQKGLSNARNTGLKEASGKYIAYLDDDAVACPKWLANMLNCFETIKPSPSCVGGKVSPIWEAPRPIWLADQLLGYLTIIDWSDIPVFIEKPRYIAGANMAFPKDVLQQLGGFSTTLGRKGKKLLSNEELDLQEKIMNEGHAIYYDPAIQVSHHAPASRLNQEWFLNRLYWQGISEAKLELQKSPSSLVERLYLATKISKRIILKRKKNKYVFAHTKDPNIFLEKCMQVKEIGYLRGIVPFPM